MWDDVVLSEDAELGAWYKLHTKDAILISEGMRAQFYQVIKHWRRGLLQQSNRGPLLAAVQIVARLRKGGALAEALPYWEFILRELVAGSTPLNELADGIELWVAASDRRSNH